MNTIIKAKVAKAIINIKILLQKPTTTPLEVSYIFLTSWSVLS